MNKESLADAMKLANELKGNLDQLLKLQSNVINQLPVEYKNALAFAEKDIKKIRESVDNGDLQTLTELTQKYANSNNSK